MSEGYGCSSVSQMFAKLKWRSGFHPLCHIKQVCWHTSVSPAFKRESQEDLEFKVIFGYITSSRQDNLGRSAAEGRGRWKRGVGEKEMGEGDRGQEIFLFESWFDYPPSHVIFGESLHFPKFPLIQKVGQSCLHLTFVERFKLQETNKQFRTMCMETLSLVIWHNCYSSKSGKILGKK